jgi:uncharacterized tellurite resistance protein B-like protein
MIAADNVIEEEEIGVLRSVHVLDATHVLSALKLFESLDQEPHRCVEPVAKVLNLEQQYSALAIMFDIAMADGEFGDEERRLLDQYIHHFTITTDHVQQLERVIKIKNAQVFEPSKETPKIQ